MNQSHKPVILRSENKGTIFPGMSHAKQNILLGLLLLVITVIAYIPVFNAGYIWDDDDYVTENRALLNAEGLKNIWIPYVLHNEETKREGLVTPQYYPVVFTTFWIERHIYPPEQVGNTDTSWGLNPLGFHIVNLLLHICNALLLVMLVRLIGIPKSAAWAIGFIFALHPVHVESVAWITERKNVLSTFFYLLTAITYLRFDKHRQFDKKDSPFAWYFLSLILFIFALLSKSIVASLPIAIIIILLYKHEKISFKRLWPLIPMLFLGVIAGLHTGFIEKVSVGALGPEWDSSFLERLLIASKSFLFYPSKIIAPVNLVFIYPRWEVEAGSLVQFWPFIVCVICGLLLALLWWKKGIRWPFLAAAFYGISIFPALGFANIYPHRFSFVADHFQYLASIGMIILAIGFVGVLARRLLKTSKTTSFILTSLLIAVLAALTFMQGTHYRDTETLYLKTIEANPNAWMTYSNLSKVHLANAQGYINSGNNEAMLKSAERAEEYAIKALDIKPDHDNALTNAAEAMRLQGKYKESIVYVKKAIDSMKNERQYHLDQIKQTDKDIPLLLNMILHLDMNEGHKKLAEIAEDTLGQNYSLLGRLYEIEKDIDSAKQAYSEAVKLEKPPAETYESLGRISMLEKRYEDAEGFYQRGLEKYPYNVRLLILHAESLRKQESYSSAKKQLIHALDVMRPQDEIKIVYALAWLTATAKDKEVRDGEYSLAVAEQMVRATKQQDPNAFDLLGVALAENGRYEDAVRVAGLAKELAVAYNMTELIKQVESRIAIYKSGKPYRE